MKSFFLQLPGNQRIDIVENPILNTPWAGSDGLLSFWQLYDTRTGKAYVGNIYQYVFALKKWDISGAARMCASIAKDHLNELIDKM